MCATQNTGSDVMCCAPQQEEQTVLLFLHAPGKLPPVPTEMEAVHIYIYMYCIRQMMLKRNLRTGHEYQSQLQQLAITTMHTMRYSVTYSWSPWRPYIGLSSSYSSCWCWWWCWCWSLPPGLGGAAGGGEDSSGMGSNGPWVALNLPEPKHLAQRSKLGTAA